MLKYVEFRYFRRFNFFKVCTQKKLNYERFLFAFYFNQRVHYSEAPTITMKEQQQKCVTLYHFLTLNICFRMIHNKAKVSFLNYWIDQTSSDKTTLSRKGKLCYEKHLLNCVHTLNGLKNQQPTIRKDGERFFPNPLQRKEWRKDIATRTAQNRSN